MKNCRIVCYIVDCRRENAWEGKQRTKGVMFVMHVEHNVSVCCDERVNDV